jgi:hypothetical protein
LPYSLIKKRFISFTTEPSAETTQMLHTHYTQKPCLTLNPRYNTRRHGGEITEHSSVALVLNLPRNKHDERGKRLPLRTIGGYEAQPPLLHRVMVSPSGHIHHRFESEPMKDRIPNPQGVAAFE